MIDLVRLLEVLEATSSDRILKKAALAFPMNLSCKTTPIVHHQSYLQLKHIALLKIADDILFVRNGTHE